MKKPRTKAPKIDVQKLKPKRRKAGKNVRNISNTCPDCLSKIVVNNLGQWECSGDKLILWQQEFVKYAKMTEIEKTQYLSSLDNKEKFIEWYSQKKSKCEWYNSTPKVTPTYSVKIPDPMAVNRVEKSLGRVLQELELEEGYKFYRRTNLQGDYTYVSGPYIVGIEDWEEYILPRVSFPEDI